MKTFDLVNFPTTEVVRILSVFLERLTKANKHLVSPSRDPDTNSSTCPSYTPFQAKSLPNIDIHMYLSRILKYCPCSNECFLALLVYFDRMTEFKDETQSYKRPFAIDIYNVHRLVITGIMIASKFFSDVYYTNVRYAKVGGLPVKELNHLELEFLRLNEFQMNISVAEFQMYGDQLLNYSTLGKPIFMGNNKEKSLKSSNTPTNNRLASNALVKEFPGSTGTDATQDLVNQPCKTKKSTKLSAGRQTGDRIIQSRKAHPRREQNKQNWCNVGFSSQRTDSEDLLSHVTSPVH